ncbi:unnamed protein product [Arctogadus glacialis]
MFPFQLSRLLEHIGNGFIQNAQSGKQKVFYTAGPLAPTVRREDVCVHPPPGTGRRCRCCVVVHVLVLPMQSEPPGDTRYRGHDSRHGGDGVSPRDYCDGANPTIT